jgi:hypothetical protein
LSIVIVVNAAEFGGDQHFMHRTIAIRAAQEIVVIFVQRRISWRDEMNERRRDRSKHEGYLQKEEIFFMI